MYSHLIYFQSDSQISFDEIIQSIKNFYANQSSVTFVEQPENLIIQFSEEYSFYIHWNTEDYVQEEAQEMLESEYFNENYSGEVLTPEKRNLFLNSNKRIEFRGDDDFDMNYFNQMLFIMAEIEKLDNVLILNCE